MKTIRYKNLIALSPVGMPAITGSGQAQDALPPLVKQMLSGA
jgi:hypothetical protein